MDDDFDELLAGRPRPTAATAAAGTAVVVRSDSSGVWCSLLMADRRHPVGPVRGATYRRITSCSEPAHTHPLEQLPVGTEVYLMSTPDGPWVLAHHEPMR